MKLKIFQTSNCFGWWLALVVVLSFGFSARAAGSQVLERHLPAAAMGLKSLGRLASTNRLNLAIALPLRNQGALSQLLDQINDPASPNYHHYLTPAEFAERFGPTAGDYESVVNFAVKNGLHVTARHPNRMLLDVSGAVSDIERTLHVTMQTYRHPTEQRNFFAPDIRPTLDLATPVLSISGLNNYSRPQPRFVAKPLFAGQNSSPETGSGPSGTFRGNDFRAAYVPDSTLNGSGQTVGLLQFDGYTATDITYYESQAGLPNITLSNVLLDGFNGNPTHSGGEIEVSLDIEMAISMATNLSQVIIYEAGPSGDWHDILNRMATDDLAKQLSCSWYIPGGGPDPVADQIWQQMAAQGQSFFNASGDNDAYTGPISFPGDTPYVTQVGGTTLTTTGPGGSRVSETVWNWGNGVGSGGGISTSYPIPSWQTNVNMAANQGSTVWRNTPDVAFIADQVYVRADGLDYNVGGTSCAAPLWAGFAALVNQQAVASGRPTIGFVNPALYALGAGANYPAAFHDITTGNNQRSGSGTKFPAVGGFDLCTGWGTPAGQALINALANPEPLLISPPAGFVSAGGVGGPFTVVSQSLWLTNSGTNTLSWTLTNQPAWLTVSPGSGVLLPGGAAVPVTATLNGSASNLSVGTYSATLWFTNLNDNFGQSRQFTLSVISPPVVTVQPVNVAALEGATASFLVSAAGGLPLAYQWQFYGTNLVDGGVISGSTTTNLLIGNVSAAAVGAYAVVITNAAGTVTSSNAVLSLTPSLPVFTQQPVSQTALVGETAAFAVAAVGTRPFAYQWSLNGTNLAAATNQTLTLPNVQLAQAGSYAVVVTNIHGAVTSSNATLTVLTNFPLVDVAFGDDGGGGVSSKTGYAAVGQATNDFWNFYDRSILPGVWRNSGALTNLLTAGGMTTGVGMSVSDAPGAWDNGSSDPMYDTYIYPLDGGNNVVTFTNLPAGQYDVLAYSADGNYEITVGGTSYGVKTTADASPGGVPVWTEGRQYARWRSVTVGAGQPLALTVRNGVGGYAILSGVQILGSAATALPPVITGQPTNQTVAVGGTASFSVSASGTAPLAYQWSVNTTNLVGATNATLVLTNLQFAQAGNYAVQITNAAGTAFSSNALLTVVAGTTNSGTLVDVAFGDDGGGGVSLKTGYAAVGQATNDFWNFYDRSTAPGVSRRSGTVVNLKTAGGMTTGVGMSVSDAPGAWDNGSSDPMYDTYIYPLDGGNNVVTFTNLPAGQYDVLAYSADGNYEITVGGTSYGVKTTADASPGGVPVWTEGRQYARWRSVTVGAGQPLALTVRNGVGGYAILSGVQILGSAATALPPVITGQPTNQTVAVGGTASFSVSASGTAPLAYQWSVNTTNLVGATNATLVLTNLQFAQAGNYAVQITNAAGTAFSSNALLTVNDRLDHFAWSPIASPQFVNVPIAVFIQAMDPTNGIFTNFTGTVNLGSTNGIPVNPSVSAAFVQGVWSGAITVSQPVANLVLQAGDGLGDSGVANAISVNSLPTLGLALSQNSLLLYWPVASSNFVIESSATLAPAQGVPVSAPPFPIGNYYLEAVPAGNSNQFYRLQYVNP